MEEVKSVILTENVELLKRDSHLLSTTKCQSRHFKLVISESSTHFSPLVNKTAHMQVKKPNINKNSIFGSIASKKQGKSVYIISSWKYTFDRICLDILQKESYVLSFYLYISYILLLPWDAFL